MAKTVVGIFDRYDNAERAAREVKDQGLRTDDISIVTKESGRDVDNSPAMGREGRAVNDNISDGVVTGGVLGGLAGLLIGAGSLAIPGLGIIAAAGPITGLLSGALTGGIVGGLIDLGIPEARSREYESDIKAGKILFSMMTDEEKAERVAEILRRNGAESVDIYEHNGDFDPKNYQ